ncbi:prepilin-type N-terminal cleavage/methylation domain-containing protein [Actinoplanes sp. NBRC 103695]|uniref:prepilin-type N-terminal cleavage/methylation domain-containing protein n=1 Tax=Actinoplanes sp. NBRC 103695 TaxID=3032202 RepID=UPI0024A354AC|nr:prepilin-type N-terminal cleavage/methylation domain-containing protein [Actinoplanes sp. NBRC 103695]GLY97338.1 hypothetical protein Acsp02_45920 [Actinoplanes sp. NBRC 103695]
MIACIGRLVRRRRDDAGFSMIEVMVGAAIMSTVMAIASQGFLSMYQSANRAEAAAVAQTQLATAFQKMDREIRYAYRVNVPYTSGGDYAVTYVVPDANNRQLCVELTLPTGGGTMMRTQWVRKPKQGETYEKSTGAVATSLVPFTAGSTPFERIPSGTADDGASSNFDRLKMNVVSTIGLSTKNARREYKLKFTAVNTAGADATNDYSCVKPA